MKNSLWQNFRFTRFLASMTISNLGDWFDIFALQIIFVHELNASPITMGILAFSYFIPAIVLSPIAGAFADRHSKRNIMIIADIVSAILTIGLILSHSTLIAILLVIVRSSIASLNSPTQQAYIKEVVPNKQLLPASSYTTISFQFAKVLGPMLGAVILLVASPRFCLGINAVSFVLSFLILLTLPSDKLILESSIQEKITYWLHDVRDGAIFAWQHALLRALLFLVAVWFFCSMVRNAQIAIFLKHLLPTEPHALGYILGLEGLGSVVAGIILSRRKKITSYAAYFFSAFLLIGLGVLGIACYQSSWPQVFLYTAPFVLGIGSGLGAVTYGYLIRTETPEKRMGCVWGINSAVQNLAMVVGTLLSGVLVIQFGVREVFIGLALLLFVLALGSLTLPRRKTNE